MPITLGTNIAALNAQRRFADGTDALTRVYERLSSGLRINRAGDDAAGLAVSSALHVDARVFAQGYRNINDGISLLGVAGGGLEQLQSVLGRMSELSAQSANGVFSSTQRAALNTEF